MSSRRWREWAPKGQNISDSPEPKALKATTQEDTFGTFGAPIPGTSQIIQDRGSDEPPSSSRGQSISDAPERAVPKVPKADSEVAFGTFDTGGLDVSQIFHGPHSGENPDPGTSQSIPDSPECEVPKVPEVSPESFSRGAFGTFDTRIPIDPQTFQGQEAAEPPAPGAERIISDSPKAPAPEAS